MSAVDPRYLEPPDLLLDEDQCPECGCVLGGDYCPDCDETFNEDTLRDAAEHAKEDPAWH